MGEQSRLFVFGYDAQGVPTSFALDATSAGLKWQVPGDFVAVTAGGGAVVQDYDQDFNTSEKTDDDSGALVSSIAAPPGGVFAGSGRVSHDTAAVRMSKSEDINTADVDWGVGTGSLLGGSAPPVCIARVPGWRLFETSASYYFEFDNSASPGFSTGNLGEQKLISDVAHTWITDVCTLKRFVPTPLRRLRADGGDARGHGMAFAQLLCSTLSVLCCAAIDIGQNHLPLPVVERVPAKSGSVLDRPSIIVFVRVTERAEVEEDSERPGGIVLDPKRPSWKAIRGQVIEVLRVNERTALEPDLRRGYFLVEQLDKLEHGLKLDVGGLYVLFLNPSERLLPNWRGNGDCVENRPPYVFAVEQAGFKVLGGSLKVIKSGGPLDRYSGRRLDDFRSIVQGLERAGRP